MAQGTVNIYDRNLDQVTPAGVEKNTVFLDLYSGKDTGGYISVNSKTNLDDALGATDSVLKKQVRAAQLNGGPEWFAQCRSIPFDEVASDFSILLEGASPEIIAVIVGRDPNDIGIEFAALSMIANDFINNHSTRAIFLFDVRGINPTTETWAAYETSLVNNIAGKISYRVGVVPNLYGTELGAVAGRLCRGDISIADSPMRVATGPMLGLGEPPVDMDGVPLPSATLAALDAARFSVVQTYRDYPGIYFGDLNLLDSPTGDFQVIEYLRPLDKAARAVRLMAIAKIANREFNSTPESIEAHKTYFARPLREMSQTKRVRDVVLPGDILPPDADAIEIIWVSKTEVEIYISIQPYNSPKKITGYVSLDLSNN